MIDPHKFSINDSASEGSFIGDAQPNSFSPTFTPEVHFWRDEILDWAQEFDLDPNLIALVMQIESCGHPNIQSNAGALGLFQVMPFHFSPDEDPLEPETNAKRGLSYLARSVELSENQVDLTLAGYNGGHGLINHHPSTWPAETQRYVKWGVGILEEIRGGKNSSSTLEAWLAAGGEHLCQKASVTQSK
jgi:soluble lytic murein transglycosylase-like protein